MMAPSYARNHIRPLILIFFMSGKKDQAGFCGIWCGSCPVYRASHDGNESLQLQVAFATRCTIDKIRCGGCRSGDLFVLSNSCAFRRCAEGRGLEACAFCDDYPCEPLEDFYEDGQDAALINSNSMRATGLNVWLDNIDKSWQCSRCGAPITIGIDTCASCGAQTAAD